MTRARERRISQLKAAIAAAPVHQHLVSEAYEWFVAAGELPDDASVAYAVVLQAVHGGEPVAWKAEQLQPARRTSLAQRVRDALEGGPPTVRGMWFQEALFEPEPLRRLARAQIAVEVAYGGDVANVAFGARHGLPVYGSMALHVAGHPSKWVRPPYEDQAKRLLVRLDTIRGRIPHHDPRWFEAQAEAEIRFMQTGELPDDDLHADAVLVSVEMDLLVAHNGGKDVGKAMKLLDRVARRGDKAAGALKELCAMVAASPLG